MKKQVLVLVLILSVIGISSAEKVMAQALEKLASDLLQKKKVVNFRVDKKALAENLKNARVVSPTGEIHECDYLDYEGDEDWYPIRAGDGWIDLWLTSIPPDCDYDLYLCDWDFTVLDSSINLGNADEYIYTSISDECEYYIGVVSYSGYSTTDDSCLDGTYPDPLPDLTVVSFSVDNQQPYVGEFITVTVKIKNQYYCADIDEGFYTDLFIKEEDEHPQFLGLPLEIMTITHGPWLWREQKSLLSHSPQMSGENDFCLLEWIVGAI